MNFVKYRGWKIDKDEVSAEDWDADVIYFWEKPSKRCFFWECEDCDQLADTKQELQETCLCEDNNGDE